ncbi:Ssl1-like-domain-containing protein [Chaetomium fimeti]|uniref:General transcription and DNA repair factor IIH n=1 Tax=Chaetomium fimeti TaxID=1854472 RepID=A0AAE0LUC5_9PEZI|nr:Ssl1-like-domain-containing protein [Chaetomium fimeti]
MADSDGEYVGDLSDDELGDPRVASAADGSSYGTRSKAGRGNRKAGDGRKNGRSKAAWEDIKRSWEHVVETEDGSITVGALLEAEKRRRLMRDTTPFQRGIIRHVMLVLDMSFAMAEKDLLPNRYLLTLNYAVDFVREYFEQNPISQLGIVGMRDGIAVRISDMGGNPAEHIEKLRIWAEQQEPQGNPSLQNALEMCRGALFHTPSHGTREVLIIYGALLSSDPGDIHDTITQLLADRIRVSIVGLAAQVAICEQLCSRTNGGDPSNYAVALHEQHFRELFLAATTPPVCRLPAECPVCALTLVLSTHLARSYHHLFPLRGWVEVSWADAARRVAGGVGSGTGGGGGGGGSGACFACLAAFPPVPSLYSGSGGGEDKAGGQGAAGAAGAAAAAAAEERTALAPEAKAAGVSESGRYACTVCGNHFCIDCDVFAHEMIHNCPGCQSDTRGAEGQAAGGEGGAVNGQAQAHALGNGASEAMVIDA